ncbi:hypothetical protein HELRODRAFT_147427, partial [Helobdella robusta]|uniref:Spondin domain-containing protein n=1 Tax=Helobdella robusta TaxID=6412 RepID=T1EK04_HELRO
ECCACGSAKYEMTFEAVWSRKTHPKDFPIADALTHWSNIVGASHTRNFSIWRYGEVASMGVKEICE